MTILTSKLSSNQRYTTSREVSAAGAEALKEPVCQTGQAKSGIRGVQGYKRTWTRQTQRCDQTRAAGTLDFCDVCPGALFRSPTRSVARMQSEQSIASSEESVAPTRRFRQCAPTARAGSDAASSGS